MCRSRLSAGSADGTRSVPATCDTAPCTDPSPRRSSPAITEPRADSASQMPLPAEPVAHSVSQRSPSLVAAANAGRWGMSVSAERVPAAPVSAENVSAPPASAARPASMARHKRIRPSWSFPARMGNIALPESQYGKRTPGPWPWCRNSPATGCRSEVGRQRRRDSSSREAA